MRTIQQPRQSEAETIWISQPGGRSNCYSDPESRFTVIASGNREAKKFLTRDPYSAAMAFIKGEFDVRGDIFAAIRYFSNQRRNKLHQFLVSMLVKIERSRLRSALDGAATKKNIQFHYDLSNEFYAQFLDPRMVYSAAFFADETDSLEAAQTQKLDRICKDLVLRPDERMLDVGCGWGGLICYAASQFGARTLGCTLSRLQFEFANQAIERQQLEDLASVKFADYREMEGPFDKIASIGMFEHVGPGRLTAYFQKLFAILRPGGLFLNRGVVRPRGASDDSETLFLQKRVFPGGELSHLDEVIREGERAGFEAVGLRDLRLHYALTCRRWVQNLQRNADHCRVLVGEMSYRTWLLYLAGSAVNFEDGYTGAAQVLFSKRR